jgi:hypothetical protein
VQAKQQKLAVAGLVAFAAAALVNVMPVQAAEVNKDVKAVVRARALGGMPGYVGERRGWLGGCAAPAALRTACAGADAR